MISFDSFGRNVFRMGGKGSLQHFDFNPLIEALLGGYILFEIMVFLRWANINIHIFFLLLIFLWTTHLLHRHQVFDISCIFSWFWVRSQSCKWIFSITFDGTYDPRLNEPNWNRRRNWNWTNSFLIATFSQFPPWHDNIQWFKWLCVCSFTIPKKCLSGSIIIIKDLIFFSSSHSPFGWGRINLSLNNDRFYGILDPDVCQRPIQWRQKNEMKWKGGPKCIFQISCFIIIIIAGLSSSMVFYFRNTLLRFLFYWKSRIRFFVLPMLIYKIYFFPLHSSSWLGWKKSTESRIKNSWIEGKEWKRENENPNQNATTWWSIASAANFFHLILDTISRQKDHDRCI